MSPFVVVMSDHKHPRYHVARKMIGKDSYSIISTSFCEHYAREIATAMSATHQAREELARSERELNILPIKPVRKRA